MGALDSVPQPWGNNCREHAVDSITDPIRLFMPMSLVLQSPDGRVRRQRLHNTSTVVTQRMTDQRDAARYAEQKDKARFMEKHRTDDKYHGVCRCAFPLGVGGGNFMKDGG